MNPLVILPGGKDALLARETFVTDLYIYIYILTDSYNLVSKFFLIVTKMSFKMESIQLSFGDKTKEI